MASAAESSVIEENKQIIRNFVEDIFNRHDLAAVDKCIKSALILERLGIPERVLYMT